MTTIKRRRPDGLSLRDAIVEFGDIKGAQKSYSKTAVSMKTAEGGDLLTIDSMTPDEAQVEKINKFTRSTKSADELLVFPTMSCNDMYDRDDEAFRQGSKGVSAIKQFHALEPPYSFVGKSFMMDHDYTVSKQIGRLFDEETVKVPIDGTDVEFLKHWVYMPNTPQFKDIAEKIDYGVQWAVSVGVVMGAAECTITGCASPMYNGRFFSFCYENGHEKGLWYDPYSEEKDAWGYAMPVAEGTKGAEKCKVDLFDPKDGYELSSVFLGAQYYAELAAKDPNFSGVVKAAAAGHLPIIGLSSKEAESLSMPHEHPAVHEARQKFAITVDEDGDATWTDDTGLKWVHDHTSNEVLSLGKEVSDGTEGQRQGDDADGQVVQGDGHQVEVNGLGDAVEGQLGAGQADDPEAGQHDAVEGSGGDPPTGLVTTEAVDMAAMLSDVGMPESIVEQVKAVVMKEEILPKIVNATASYIKGLEKRAELGDEYVKGLQAEAIDWYTKAHFEQDKKGVDTSVFQKMLDRIGDDLELLKEVTEEQKSMARAKFPQAVRRSSFEKDANTADEMDDEVVASKDGTTGDQTVRQIHR